MDKTDEIQSNLDSTVLENAAELTEFMDIEYSIDFRVGDAELTVRQLLVLKEGDRIRMNRRTSDNVLVMIEDTVLGEAEVFPTKSGAGVRVIEGTQ
jgi:flagellar motor switch/type III secretory pathway protein FliN